MILRALSFCFALPLLWGQVAQPLAAQTLQVGLGAERTAPGTELEVLSDSLRVDQGSGLSIFTGNVVAVQGDMYLTAQEVFVYAIMDENQRATGIERLEAFGGVTLVTSAEAAEAREGIYYVQTNQADLRGDVVLVQGDSVLAGDRLLIDMRDGTGQMEGRVRTILQTGQ